MTTINDPGQRAIIRPSLSAGDNTISADLYRQTYVALRLPDTATVVIGITSAIRGEGRTTIACGLAQTLADDLGMSVLLVEADLARPALAERFGVAVTPGLAEVLRGESHLSEVLQVVSPTLTVITAGDVRGDAPRLLRRLGLQDPFHDPQAPPGIIILDLPPIVTESYGAVTANAADALVLVLRAAVTPDSVVREALARLEDRPPQGIIFNGARSALPSWWPGSRL